jgi:tRNA (guanine6-N2)-methyltransferase
VNLRLVARSVRGLEWAVADEISARLPGAAKITMSSREVGFELPEPELNREVLGLRLADDLFLEVGTVTGVGRTKDVPAAAAGRVAALDWTAALTRLKAARELPGQPAFDVVVSLLGRRNYNRFDMENAIGRALLPLLGGAYLARTSEGRQEGEPDLTIRVFVSDGEARMTLRVADRPLHRRWYKQDTGPGTLHPPVAAALARLGVTTYTATVADPFCGDGTIAIETARAWPDSRVVAGDIDAERLRNTRHNAARAGVRISLTRLDSGILPWSAAGIDAVVTNPPWNVAVDAGGRLRSSMDRFWRQLPRLLSQRGRLCLIADADLGVPARLGRMDYQIALATQIRLAGRVSDLLLCAPSGNDTPQVPAGLARWRDRAMAEGVSTEAGFLGLAAKLLTVAAVPEFVHKGGAGWAPAKVVPGFGRVGALIEQEDLGEVVAQAGPGLFLGAGNRSRGADRDSGRLR